MIQQIDFFMDFYQKKLATIDNKKNQLEKDKKNLLNEIQIISDKIKKENDIERVFDIFILMKTEESNTISLQLSYIVMNGGNWSASYDVRVDSNSNIIDLHYYGSIINSSNEDWNNVMLVLSTAKPSISGNPPKLTTKTIDFLESKPVYDYRKEKKSRIISVPLLRKEISEEISDSCLTTTAEESVTCTLFNIPRACDIKCDGKPHKVTITMLQLEGVFSYESVPCLNLSAFLKAEIKNTTENFPLLAGVVNVFMDNNFVCKSDINNIFPQETFFLFLGVDPSIKIEYKNSAIQDKQGVMKKTNIKTSEIKIIIKNTKNKEIQLSLFEQLPKSSNGQIKIKLLNPNVENRDSPATLTDLNFIHWDLKISAKEIKEIPVKYTVDWPLDKKISL
jgi:uncharacterized protein (TIGR02231 family)